MQIAQQAPFRSFHIKIRRDRLLKSAIIGLSAAAFAAGAVLLLSKLLEFSSNFSLLGLVALPLGFALSFCLQKADRRTLARTLDDRFALHERVQTMIAFSDSDEPLAQVQRADAQARLAEISPRRMGFSHLAFYIAFPVVSLALLAAAMLFPTATEPTVPTTKPTAPPREITDWEWQALDELIETVRASAADETCMKPQTLAALENLRTRLERGVSETALPTAVQTTVTAVNNAEAEANAQDTLSEHQKEINTEVCLSTVAKLYEIFKLTKPTEEVETTPEDNPSEGDTDSSNASGGSNDQAAASNDRIFDPDQGSVLYKYVIGDYLAAMDKAFEEEVLSYEEWYDYMQAYFGALNTPR